MTRFDVAPIPSCLRLAGALVVLATLSQTACGPSDSDDGTAPVSPATPEPGGDASSEDGSTRVPPEQPGDADGGSDAAPTLPLPTAECTWTKSSVPPTGGAAMRAEAGKLVIERSAKSGVVTKLSQKPLTKDFDVTLSVLSTDSKAATEYVGASLSTEDAALNLRAQIGLDLFEEDVEASVSDSLSSVACSSSGSPIATPVFPVVVHMVRKGASVSVIVTDANKRSASKTCTLAAADAPVIASILSGGEGGAPAVLGTLDDWILRGDGECFDDFAKQRF